MAVSAAAWQAPHFSALLESTDNGYPVWLLIDPSLRENERPPFEPNHMIGRNDVLRRGWAALSVDEREEVNERVELNTSGYYGAAAPPATRQAQCAAAWRWP